MIPMTAGEGEACVVLPLKVTKQVPTFREKLYNFTLSCPLSSIHKKDLNNLTPTRLALKGERGHCRARIAYGSHEITLVLGVDGVVCCGTRVLLR